MERTPLRKSSPTAINSLMTIGERVMERMTTSWPRSMRFAIVTSPSRVSSGTVPVFLAFAVSAVDRHFHRTRGLGRRLVFVNLDTIALERREEIVDFFRGMHFRG